MISLLLHLIRLLPFLVGGHRQLALENLALRQQLAVYNRTLPRPKLRMMDRLFWIGLARTWTGWRQALIIVYPRRPPAMAAPPFRRVLDPAVRSVHRRPASRSCQDRRPPRENGGGESNMGCALHHRRRIIHFNIHRAPHRPLDRSADRRRLRGLDLNPTLWRRRALVARSLGPLSLRPSPCDETRGTRTATRGERRLWRRGEW